MAACIIEGFTNMHHSDGDGAIYIFFGAPNGFCLFWHEYDFRLDRRITFGEFTNTRLLIQYMPFRACDGLSTFRGTYDRTGQLEIVTQYAQHTVTLAFRISAPNLMMASQNANAQDGGSKPRKSFIINAFVEMCE